MSKYWTQLARSEELTEFMKIKNNVDYLAYKKRKRVNRNRRLLFVFFSTFVVVLLFFTWLASALTPKIDIPVISEKDQIPSMTSDDFKGRIDSRLKLIEMQDDNPSSYLSNEDDDDKKENKTKKDKDDNDDKNKNKQKDKDLDDDKKDDNKDKEAKKPPKVTPSLTAKTTKPQAVPRPKPPAQQKVIRQNPNAPQLHLRNRISPNQPQAKLKVLMGRYSTPAQAKQASNALVGQGYGVTPFVRKVNGTYTLQVGSFDTLQRANSYANRLKKTIKTL